MSQDITPATVIEPIDREGLIRLSEKGKANPVATPTLKVKTVLEKKFRHLNFVRDLAVHVIDEGVGRADRALGPLVACGEYAADACGRGSAAGVIAGARERCF